MKVVFISNFFNHHQKPFSDAMAAKCDYYFIATSEMPPERVKLGYRTEWDVPYLLETHNRNNVDQISNIINSSDAVIIGSAPNSLITARLREKKIVFRYSERPLKNGFQIWKYLPRYVRWHCANPPNTPIYMLCASAYTATDYAKFGLFKNRSFKWGYFPECKHYDTSILLSQKKATEILWCGRFLDWKHPDDVLRVAEQLKYENIAFQMKLIGTGPLDAELRQYVSDHGLSEYVEFLGSMSPERVRQHMEHAGIFLFTSDRKEGWGAVLNEAMNSGCAVIASHSIGSVPFLITNGVNGLVYENGNINDLYKNVRYLLLNPEKQLCLGRAAYKTICNEWNAKNAVERFVSLTEHIQQGDNALNLFRSGPCSPAQPLHENWFKIRKGKSTR